MPCEESAVFQGTCTNCRNKTEPPVATKQRATQAALDAGWLLMGQDRWFCTNCFDPQVILAEGINASTGDNTDD